MKCQLLNSHEEGPKSPIIVESSYISLPKLMIPKQHTKLERRGDFGVSTKKNCKLKCMRLPEYLWPTSERSHRFGP